MKKIIILIILVVLSLGGGAAYYFFFMNGTEETLSAESDMEIFPDSLSDSLQPPAIVSDTVIIADESHEIDSLNNTALIDSLNNQIMVQLSLLNEYKIENEKLINELNAVKQQVISIKGIAKTYESMKTAEIKPILANVDDGTVIAIYNNMSNRSKKLIFNALNPKRAGKITELLAGVKKED